MGSRMRKDIMRRRTGAVTALPQVKIGGLAVGGVVQRALSLGALTVGRLKVGKANLKEVTVGRLKVDELIIGDHVVTVGDLSSVS